MSTNQPENWRPLVEPGTERRRRNWIIGLTTLFALVGLGVVGLVIALLMWDTDLREGYTMDDVCWVEEGTTEADGQFSAAEVPCWEEHDYVSGETVATDEDCPVTSLGALQGDDGRAICLERPR